MTSFRVKCYNFIPNQVCSLTIGLFIFVFDTKKIRPLGAEDSRMSGSTVHLKSKKNGTEKANQDWITGDELTREQSKENPQTAIGLFLECFLTFRNGYSGR